jgi:type III secretion protein Q
MTSLPLTKFGLEETRLINTIAGWRRILGFEAGGGKWTWRFRPKLLGFKPTLRVTLKLGDEAVHADVENLPELARCGAQFAGVVLDELPRDLWLSVLDAALEPLLNRAAEALHAPVSIISILPKPDGTSEAGGLFFELYRDGEPLFSRGQLSLTAVELQRIAALVSPVAPQPNGDDFDLVPFPARLVMGETRLAAGEYQALERGDIILLDRHAASESPLCDLVFSTSISYRARQQEGRLILDRMATDTAAPNPAPAAAPAAANLDTLPVHLVFEAGHKQLTLAELKRLEPGYTFELDQPADRPLTIRANGQAVGVGELVQIGDRIGVRVLEWVASVAPTKA